MCLHAVYTVPNCLQLGCTEFLDTVPKGRFIIYEMGGGISCKSLYLSWMTLFKQPILYVSLYYPKDSKKSKIYPPPNNASKIVRPPLTKKLKVPKIPTNHEKSPKFFAPPLQRVQNFLPPFATRPNFFAPPSLQVQNFLSPPPEVEGAGFFGNLPKRGHLFSEQRYYENIFLCISGKNNPKIKLSVKNS